MNTIDLQKLAKEFQHIDQIIELVPVMQKMPVVEVAEILKSIDETYLLNVLDRFTMEQQGLIVAEFPMVKQLNLFKVTSQKTLCKNFWEYAVW